MEIIMMIVAAVALAIQMTLMKVATVKYIKNNAQYFVYNGILCLVAGIIAFIWRDKPLVVPQLSTIILGVLYGVSFISASIVCVKAAVSGPLSLTTLFSNFSMMVVIVYSLLFLNEQLSVLKVFGILFIFITFVIVTDFKAKGSKKEITTKWLILAILLVLTNGFGGVFQQMHQNILPGIDINEFLIIGYFSASIIAFIYVLFIKGKSEEKVFNKGGSVIATTSGILSLVAIKFIMLLASKVDGSILFPFINATLVVLVTVASRVIFKEKFTIKKIIGIATGMISVILLSM